MATRGPKIPGAPFSEKNLLIFLKFIGPVATLWVLQPSQSMHMVSTESLLARAVFARSIKSAWVAARGPKIPGARFSEKKRPFFEIHRTSETSMGSVALGNHGYGLYGTFTSHINFWRSIKVLGWQSGAPKLPRARFSEKNVLIFLKFIEPVTPRWVL